MKHAAMQTLDTFWRDCLGGITAAVVSLPIVVGLGISSGLGPTAGLYGAILVGFCASALGSTKAQISCPATATTIVIATTVASHASDLTAVAIIIWLSGLLQVLLGISGIGRFVVYVPHMVVSGFTSGIGIVFAITQILPVLGAPVSPGGAMQTISALPGGVAEINFSAFAVAALTLVVAVLLPPLGTWLRSPLAALPSPLVTLMVGTLTGILWLPDAPAIGAVSAGPPDIGLGPISAQLLIQAVEPALVLAFLGSINSLLTSLVADSLTDTRHNPSRELVAQGVGNMAAGVFGALPGAGSTALTATNVHAGARTRMSGVLCGLFLLALVLGLGRFVGRIPHAALAAVLMKAGLDVVDWKLLARVHRLPRETSVVLLLSLTVTVFVDLTTALAVGMIAAEMVRRQRSEAPEVDSVTSTPLLDRAFLPGRDETPASNPFAARVGLVKFRGSYTVSSSRRLHAMLAMEITDHEVIIFDFSDAVDFDDSAAAAMMKLVDLAARHRAPVIVMGLSGAVASTLYSLDVLQRVPEERIVETLPDAQRVAADLLQDSGR